MSKLFNRAKMTTTTAGTGNLTLGSAADGFVTFAAAGVVNGDVVRYCIEAENGTDFEIGEGSYTASGTVLSRADADVQLSSNSNNRITLAAGTHNVFITAADSDFAQEITVTVAAGKFVIDGTSQQIITLLPSITYRLDQSDSTNSSHPLVLASGSADGSTYSTGIRTVGTPGSKGAYTEVKLEQDAPALWYKCSSHSNMGNSVNTGAQPVGTGVTVYASQSAMLAADASSAVTEGSLHYDTGANKLYVKMGDASSTGFYLLASITNASPTISSPSTGTAFELDGSPNPTTISISASDSDAGQALNYYYTVSTGTVGSGTTVTTSATSNGTYASSGNAVAGSSNASTNSHFRINPSNSVATSFSLTFYVTDGTNIANTICSFSLAFTIPNSRYTALLMSANAAGDNSTFTDSSPTTPHTITPNSDPAQGSFSPYRQGGYAAEFDATGDYLSTSTSSDFSFGTGDFTVECWVTKDALTHKGIWQISNSSSGLQSSNYTNTIALGYQNSVLQIYGAGNSPTASAPITAKTWFHVAYVRSSNVSKLYCDGTEIISQSDTTNYAHTNMVIGGYYDSSYLHNGKISNLRVVKGTAVYTSNFTPPTEPLTATSNTKLLACFLPYIADANTQVTPKTITVSGDPKVVPSSPYDNTTQNAATDSGSVYFDGTNSLTTPNSTDFDLVYNNFTIKFWMYPISVTGYNKAVQRYDNTAGSWSFGIQADKTVRLLTRNSSGLTNNIFSSKLISYNQWYYVEISPTTTKLNGETWISSSNTALGTHGANRPLIIGSGANNSGVPEAYFHGYISDFQIVNGGTATESTIPTAPMSTDSNSKIHLKLLESKVFDKSQSSNLALKGNATGSTSQTKFAAASLALDGSGDYAVSTDSTNYNFGTGDLTLEAWVYWTGSGSNVILDTRSTTSASDGVMIRTNSSGYLEMYSGSSRIADNTALTANAWVFVQMTRASNVSKLYKNSVQVGNNYSDSVNYSHDGCVVGADVGGGSGWAGFLSDVRVTKGLARTASTPTAALKG